MCCAVGACCSLHVMAWAQVGHCVSCCGHVLWVRTAHCHHAVDTHWLSGVVAQACISHHITVVPWACATCCMLCCEHTLLIAVMLWTHAARHVSWCSHALAITLLSHVVLWQALSIAIPTPIVCCTVACVVGCIAVVLQHGSTIVCHVMLCCVVLCCAVSVAVACCAMATLVLVDHADQ
jgi:hypothetical protein